MEAIKFLKLSKVKNGYGLGGSSMIYVAVKGDKLGYLPNEENPYLPLGGRKTLKSVASILVFK